MASMSSMLVEKPGDRGAGSRYERRMCGGRWCGLPAVTLGGIVGVVGTVVWLAVVSSYLTAVRSDVAALMAGSGTRPPSASPPPASDGGAIVGSLPLACVRDGGIVPGTPLSPASIPATGVAGIPAGLRAGGGTTAYVGAQQLAFGAAAAVAPVKSVVLALDPSTVAVAYRVAGGASYVVVVAAAAAGDWVSGASIPVPPPAAVGLRGGAAAAGVASPSSTPVRVPVAVDTAVVVAAWGPGGEAALLFAGGGAVVAATLAQSTGAFSFGAPVNYTSGVTVDTQAVALGLPNFFVSYFDANPGTGRLAVYGRAGALSLAAGAPSVTLGAPAALADDHETRGLAALPAVGAGVAGSVALFFTADNATAATSDDDEEPGFPIGVVLVTVMQDLSLAAVWGKGGALAPAPDASRFAQPWLQQGVRAHFFLDAATLGTRALDTAALVVVAGVDAAASNAVTATSVWLSPAAPPAAPTVVWADVARVTPGGAIASYTPFAMLPLRADPTTPPPGGALAVPFLLAYSDGAGGAAPTLAVGTASLTDGALCLLTPPLPLAGGGAAAAGPPLAAATVGNGVALLVHAGALSGTLNMTLVEVGAPAVAVAADTASCTVGMPSATTLRAALHGGTALNASAWLTPGARAAAMPGLPLYATSRGAVVPALSWPLVPANAPPGAAALQVVLPPAAQFGILGRDASAALVAPEYATLGGTTAIPANAPLCALALPPFA